MPRSLNEPVGFWPSSFRYSSTPELGAEPRRRAGAASSPRRATRSAWPRLTGRRSRKRSIRPTTVGAKERASNRGLEPRLQDREHLVARLEARLAHGDLRLASAHDRDQARPVGQVDLAHEPARARRVLGELDLGDLELLAAQAQELDELVVRELVLDQRHDRRGRADGRGDAEQVERLLVARVVDAGDRALDAVAVARDLADDDVVLVVAGDGDDEPGTADAAALEHVQLGRVAVLHDVLELLLERVVAIRSLLDHRDLVAHARAGPW